MANPSIATLRLRARRLQAVKTFEQLAALLRCPVLELLGWASHPRYRTFRIPKKKGGMRVIEDPLPGLKKVQRRLNNFLQALYYFHRSAAAYGFVLNPRNDPAPRHILSNAQQHLGGTYILNVDLKDFFHDISEVRVAQLFRAPLLGFDQELSEVLASLCCFHGRLPMGAPSSPVISNLVTIPLDQNLLNYCQQEAWCYTRYADDMSFSGARPFEAAQLKQITHRIEQSGFKVNPAKVRRFGPDDEIREITGLGLSKGEVVLPQDYLPLLQQAIGRLDEVMDAQFGTSSGKDSNSRWVRELQQQVRGKLEFARQILGSTHTDFVDIEEQYWSALEPPVHYGPLTWLAFGYDGLK